MRPEFLVTLKSNYDVICAIEFQFRRDFMTLKNRTKIDCDLYFSASYIRKYTALSLTGKNH